MSDRPSHCGKPMEIFCMSSGNKDTAIVFECDCGFKRGGRIKPMGNLILSPTRE